MDARCARNYKSLNISAERSCTCQVSTPYSNTAFDFSQSPSRPWISVPIDRRSGGLLMAKNRRRLKKKRAKRSQRMGFVRDIPQL